MIKLNLTIFDFTTEDTSEQCYYQPIRLEYVKCRMIQSENLKKYAGTSNH